MKNNLGESRGGGPVAQGHSDDDHVAEEIEVVCFAPTHTNRYVRYKENRSARNLEPNRTLFFPTMGNPIAQISNFIHTYMRSLMFHPSNLPFLLILPILFLLSLILHRLHMPQFSVPRCILPLFRWNVIAVQIVQCKIFNHPNPRHNKGFTRVSYRAFRLLQHLGYAYIIRVPKRDPSNLPSLTRLWKDISPSSYFYLCLNLAFHLPLSSGFVTHFALYPYPSLFAPFLFVFYSRLLR